MRRSSFYENIIYSVIWVLLFVAPLMTEWMHVTQEGEEMVMHWDRVSHVWTTLLLYLIIFILHNWVLVPQLVYRHRRWLYFSCVMALTLSFITYQCVDQPKHEHRERPQHEHIRHALPDEEPWMADEDFPQRMEPPQRMDPHAPEQQPPFFFSEHDMMSTVILLLLLGMNWGVKLAFKQREDRKRMEHLEKKNLEQQLEYLRYQVNPHFFMNTLNNIHALVDIDPELAKETIVELSKMMRFVLYEGSKSLVPLDSEISFLGHYIALMRLRYTDRVRIDVTMPEHTPAMMLPPLLLITFVENAFKHGVSYEQPSFIDISLSVKEGTLTFVCCNSRHASQAKSLGGVGLRNVRQRLELLYPNRYTLDIREEKDSYRVELTINE